MGRPPVIPAEKKQRIVLSVLAGEMSIAQAARDLGTQGGLVALGPGGDVLAFLTAHLAG